MPSNTQIYGHRFDDFWASNTQICGHHPSGASRGLSGTLDDLPLSIADGDFESNQSRGDRARHGVRLSRLGDDASLAVSV